MRTSERNRRPTQKLVSPFAIAMGTTMTAVGLLLIPAAFLAFALNGNEAAGDPTTYIQIPLIAAGLLLVRWGQRYERTFAIPEQPGKAVDEVVAWGLRVPDVRAKREGTTVVFTRRRHPIWAVSLGSVWLVALSPVGVGLFPVGTVVFALGMLFFLVRTTETLTVSAYAAGVGSTVTIEGMASTALMQQMERLIATSIEPQGRRRSIREMGSRARERDGAPAARSSIVWTRTGVRYLMGYTTEPTGPTAFCIWDRRAPGPPFFRFPYTSEGEEQAEARFRTLEPQTIAP